MPDQELPPAEGEEAEEQSLEELEAEIRRDFQDEARELIAEIAAAFERLAEAELPPQDLDTLARTIHSLKGGASGWGFMEAASWVTDLEEVVLAVGHGRLPRDRQVVDELLGLLDIVSHWVDDAPPPTPLPSTENSPLRPRLDQLSRVEAREWERGYGHLDPAFTAHLGKEQRRRILNARDSGKRIFALRFVLPPDGSPDQVARLNLEANNLGKVLVLVVPPSPPGAPPGPPPGRYLMVFSASSPPEGLEQKYADLGPLVEEVLAREPKSRKKSKAKAPPTPPPEAGPEGLDQPSPEAPAASVQTPSAPAEPVGPAAPAPDSDEDYREFMDELRRMFMESARERLQNLSDLLLSLEQEPEDDEIVNEIFREAHNLKGTGASFGFMPVSELGHSMETLLDKVRRKELTAGPEIMDVLFQALDVLRDLFRLIDEGASLDQVPLPILEVLNSAARGLPPTATPALLAPPPAPAAPMVFENSARISLPKLDTLSELAGSLVVGNHNLNSNLARMEKLINLGKELSRHLEEVRAVLGAQLPASHQEPDENQNRALEEVEDALAQVGGTGEYLRETMSSAALQERLALQELQKLILQIRMVPASKVFERVPRLVRDLCRAQGKEVNLTLEGAETRLDKRILEGLSDPLVHLVRNAVDHGIEAPADREAAGKPRAGSLVLRARQLGDQVWIEIAEDGAGINAEKIRARARERHLLDEDTLAAMEPEDLYSLIFLPGFSTAEKVSDISGRGVGMDVVKTNLEALKGTIEIRSQQGQGTVFSLKVPLTLAIMGGLMVECGKQRFILPTLSIDEVLKLPNSETRDECGRWLMDLPDASLPLVPLSRLLGKDGQVMAGADSSLSVVAMRSVERRIGLVVDRFVDHLEVVAKPCGNLLTRMLGIAGATVLGNGEIVLILNAADLFRFVSGVSAAPPSEIPRERQAPSRQTPVILLADDAFIPRELTRVILRDAGYAVKAVANGEEAIRFLSEHPVMLVVSDVEMPVMNGTQLTLTIKRTPEWSRIPVIILSTFSRDEMKKRGLDCPADGYLTKGEFQHQQLLDLVRDLAGEASPRPLHF